MLEAILFGVAALVVIFVAIIKWDDIVAWFQSLSKIKEKDKANVAFTLKQKMDSGKFAVVQGIFNQDNNKILEGRTIETKELDTQLAEHHKKEELVIYN